MSIYDAEAPEGASDYLKIKSGETVRIRMVGTPIQYDDSYEGKANVQFASLCLLRDPQTKTSSMKGFRFGWTIQKALRALYKDEEWGDPTGYDVAIHRDGEKLDTKYSVVPKPKGELSKADQELIKACTLDLNKMFVENAKPIAKSGEAEEYSPFDDVD